mmetsp:Transcript_18369/g.28650  ORF Transcript_18369/g.28650 Transcript_18369/m.28650 type:complete len:94 (-) Transcript_18369:631-912(-)
MHLDLNCQESESADTSTQAGLAVVQHQAGTPTIHKHFGQKFNTNSALYSVMIQLLHPTPLHSGCTGIGTPLYTCHRKPAKDLDVEHLDMQYRD